MRNRRELVFRPWRTSQLRLPLASTCLATTPTTRPTMVNTRIFQFGGRVKKMASTNSTSAARKKTRKKRSAWVEGDASVTASTATRAAATATSPAGSVRAHAGSSMAACTTCRTTSRWKTACVGSAITRARAACTGVATAPADSAANSPSAARKKATSTARAVRAVSTTVCADSAGTWTHVRQARPRPRRRRAWARPRPRPRRARQVVQLPAWRAHPVRARGLKRRGRSSPSLLCAWVRRRWWWHA